MNAKKPPSSYLRLKGDFYKRTEKKHYLDNQTFLAKITEYRKAVMKSKRKRIPIPNEIAELLYAIARNLSNCPCFAKYPYKEDMVQEAIINCIQCINNFEIAKEIGERQKSAFSYFTQVIYWAYLRKIKKEKKVLVSKFKFTESYFNGEICLDTKFIKNGFFNDESLFENPSKEEVFRKSPAKREKFATSREYMNGFIDKFEKSNSDKAKAKRERKIKKDLYDLDISEFLEQ